MGYEIHIIRQNDYDDIEEVSNITHAEWSAYIEADPELQLTEDYEINLPVLLNAADIASKDDEVNRDCEWISHPRSDTDTIPFFYFSNGSIITKNPDNHTVEKMIRISVALKGKVRGDDGEYYDETFFINGGNPIQ